MDEILRALRPDSMVLDLGALNGSFPLERFPHLRVVRVDMEHPATATASGFVQANAAVLPFQTACFDAIIANHSLEHVEDFAGTLREMARVIRKTGSIYVAVPDGCSFSDRLFRWAYDGGGHVNAFCSGEELAERISVATGLGCVAKRDLYSSFEYLNRYYFPHGMPFLLRFLGNGSRRSIMILSYITRLIDRVWGARASAYGWALYFGEVGEKVSTQAWSNVCIGCGSGAPAAWLVAAGHVYRRLGFFRMYKCPSCQAENLLTDDPEAEEPRKRFRKVKGPVRP